MIVSLCLCVGVESVGVLQVEMENKELEEMVMMLSRLFHQYEMWFITELAELRNPDMEVFKTACIATAVILKYTLITNEASYVLIQIQLSWKLSKDPLKPIESVQILVLS